MGAKYCVIEEDKGPVFLEISVEPSIVAGGDFKLIKPETEETIKNWKATVDNETPLKNKIHPDPKTLHKAALAWELLVCSLNPDIFESQIKIRITQGGKVCKTNAPLNSTRLNIPPCKVNEPDSFRDAVIFIIKKPLA